VRLLGLVLGLLGLLVGLVGPILGTMRPLVGLLGLVLRLLHLALDLCASMAGRPAAVVRISVEYLTLLSPLVLCEIMPN